MTRVSVDDIIASRTTRICLDGDRGAEFYAFLDMQDAIPENVRNGGTWALTTEAFMLIQWLVDSTGQHIYRRDWTFFGYPVSVRTNDYPWLDLENNICAFGDLRELGWAAGHVAYGFLKPAE